MPLWYAFLRLEACLNLCSIPFLPKQLLWLADYLYKAIETATQSEPGGCRTIRVRKYLQLGTVQGDCEKLSSLFVWLTIMRQVIIHQIANQRWALIWIWRAILISRFVSVQCYAIYMNNHIFSSIQQTCAPFPVMKLNVPGCSLMADSL